MNRLTGRNESLRISIINKLKKIIPMVVNSNGNVDLHKLSEILNGRTVSNDTSHFLFTWNGKRNAMENALKSSTNTLIPEPEKSSYSWDKSHNLYIEGDNLESMKLLRKSYGGKIDLIYIDPPYNTGTDRVYKDNYKESSKSYLKQTGQLSNKGYKLNTNKDSSGKFHTNWLNMMYPRTILAHELLSNHGVMFVNLDDSEVFNYKKVMDEVFGEHNFLADIIWQSTSSVTSQPLISKSITHTLVYFKNYDYFDKHKSEFKFPESGSGFSNPDNDPRGPWKADPFQVVGKRPNQLYPIVNPNTHKKFYPNSNRCWANDYKHFQKLVKEDRIWFGKDGTAAPTRKRFLYEAKKRGRTPRTLWTSKEAGTTHNGTTRIKHLFGDIVFDNPKPVKLLQRIISLSTNKNSIVLDFFSGSATTAEAVLTQNKKDNGHRHFILIQLPQNLYESLKSENKDQAIYTKKAIKYLREHNQSPILTNIGIDRINLAIKDLGIKDGGFKVFKQDSSNMKIWDPNVSNVQEEILNMNNDFKDNRTKSDIVYEILLKKGFDLNSRVSKVIINNCYIYSINYGRLYIILGSGIINNEIVKFINNNNKSNNILNQDSNIVFQDAVFSTDNSKINSFEQLLSDNFLKSNLEEL